MRIPERISALALVMILAIAVGNAFADPEYGWRGMGPGMMGGYGMMGMGDFRELGLNAEQQAKVSQLRKDARNKQWPLMSEMMDEQEKLQDLYDADKPDEAAINKQYKVVEELRRKMVDNSVEANNKMEAVLTKEQREKLRSWGGRGYRHHMMW